MFATLHKFFSAMLLSKQNKGSEYCKLAAFQVNILAAFQAIFERLITAKNIVGGIL